MENIITCSPLCVLFPLTAPELNAHSVTAAIAFGHERAQIGILIETPPELQIDVKNPMQLADLRNTVWYLSTSISPVCATELIPNCYALILGPSLKKPMRLHQDSAVFSRR
jgi:hypothetical protein